MAHFYTIHSLGNTQCVSFETVVAEPCPAGECNLNGYWERLLEKYKLYNIPSLEIKFNYSSCKYDVANESHLATLVSATNFDTEGLVFCAGIDSQGKLLPVFGAGHMILEAQKTGKTLVLAESLRKFGERFEGAEDSVVFFDRVDEVLEWVRHREEDENEDQEIQEIQEIQHSAIGRVVHGIKERDSVLVVYDPCETCSDDIINEVRNALGPPDGRALTDLLCSVSLHSTEPPIVPTRPVVNITPVTDIDKVIGIDEPSLAHQAMHGVLVIRELQLCNDFLLRHIRSSLKDTPTTVLMLAPDAPCTPSEEDSHQFTWISTDYIKHVHRSAEMLGCIAKLHINQQDNEK